jgi:mono/diheme cytochrome c family protein
MKFTTFFPRYLAPLVLLLLLSACSFSLAEDITPPPGSNLPAEMPTQAPPEGPLYPQVPPSPANGAPIYVEKCAPCHGETGLGDGLQASQLPNPPSALGDANVARQAIPADWYLAVTQGNLEKFMPPFNSLSDSQRWDVVAYALSLSVSPQTLAEGEALYQENCAACHGETGAGDGIEADSLEVQPPDLTDQKRMATISDADLFQAISAGVAPAMPAYEDQLTEAQRWALASYQRSLTFATSAGTDLAGQATPAGTTASPGETQATEVTGTPQTTQAMPAVGSISGQVTNASGGEIPGGLMVTLHGFDEMQETTTVSTTVSPEGVYTFENVEMPNGRAFIASLEQDGVVYSSDVVMVEEGQATLDLPISFFETSTDPSSLIVDRLHLLVEYIEPDILRVVELYIISNPTEKTIVAAEEDSPLLTFALPEGATNLQFEDGQLGERFVETSGGFGDRASIRPGMSQHQVVFSYDLPYKRKLQFTQPLQLPVNAVVMLIPEDGLKVKSEQLEDMGVRDVQGVNYRMYSSGQFEAGSDLMMTISGRPGGGSLIPTAGSSTSLLIGLLAFGVALVGVGIWLYRRYQSNENEQVEEETSAGDVEETTPSDPEELLDAILALDDQYQAGDLPEGAYRQRRAELKARLKEVLEK